MSNFFTSVFRALRADRGPRLSHGTYRNSMFEVVPAQNNFGLRRDLPTQTYTIWPLKSFGLKTLFLIVRSSFRKIPAFPSCARGERAYNRVFGRRATRTPPARGGRRGPGLRRAHTRETPPEMGVSLIFNCVFCGAADS